VAAEDFYNQLRQKVAGYSGPYADYLLLAPDLFMLVSRLMLDKRVDGRHKIYLGAALAYAISPIDLISERRFGVLGYLDDVAIMVAALNMLINEIDPQIVLDNWSGKADLLASLKQILGDADQLIGKGRLEKILAVLGISRPAPFHDRSTPQET
jgi:uncharacterized membrane protein YkvA (DUF1232 family)